MPNLQQRLDQVREVRRLERELPEKNGMPKRTDILNSSGTIDPRVLSLPPYTPKPASVDEDGDVDMDEEKKLSQRISDGRDPPPDKIVPEEHKPFQNVSYGRHKDMNNTISDENPAHQNVFYGREKTTARGNRRVYPEPTAATRSWPEAQQKGDLFQNVSHGRPKPMGEPRPWPEIQMQQALFQNVRYGRSNGAPLPPPKSDPFVSQDMKAQSPEIDAKTVLTSASAEYTTYKPKSILPSRRQEKVIA